IDTRPVHQASRRALWLAGAALAVEGGIAGWLAARTSTRATMSSGLRLTFQQLTMSPAGEGSPSIAPVGESFVFVKRDGGDADIFLQRVDGTRAISLTADCDQYDYDPAYAPDGRSIAYRSECAGGGIFVMGATGESARRVVDFGFAPAWSP